MSSTLRKLAKISSEEMIDTAAGFRKSDRRRVKKYSVGVVISCVRRPTGRIAASDFTPSQLIEAVRVGLPVHELIGLQASLAVLMERLGTLLGISKATLHRRKAGGRLGPAESDRVVRFARLMGKAVEVLESEANACHWLTSPQVGLGGAVPLDYAGTEVGAREVEDLLGRIEHGVYS
jgi:putative toxin-antitoxin system antitoxin component (TIGR02293 family)